MLVCLSIGQESASTSRSPESYRRNRARMPPVPGPWEPSARRLLQIQLGTRQKLGQAGLACCLMLLAELACLFDIYFTQIY